MTFLMSLPTSWLATADFAASSSSALVASAGTMARPRTYNNKGVVDEYRRPKLAYQTVKKCFAGDPRPEKEGP